MRFRKRPLVIEAVQWTGENPGEVKAFVGMRPGTREQGFQLPEATTESSDQASVWAEAEGCWIRCPVGHWLIRGVSGEYYPHAPDTFQMTYEPVGDST